MATQYFSSSYGQAREKFLAAAKEAGASLEHRLNPKAKGPEGEELYTDVARLGPDNARKALTIISGTHGNEGFCGSGCQIGYLTEDWQSRLDGETALVFIHAINPYGFAHVRRVTEDNVDINRNFVDHTKPYPVNKGYEELHQYAVPKEWANGGVEEANKHLLAYGEKHGAMALQHAMSGGQYSHPDGIFFGGNAPTWSNETLRAILKDHMSGMDHIAMIDFHTGLGPNGYGELILSSDHAKAFDRAQSWYNGEVTSIEDGSSTSAELTGMNWFAFLDVIEKENLTGIAVEYGTYDVVSVLSAMRFDNWINLYEEPGTDLWKEGKKAIYQALYCDNDEWKAKIWDRAEWVLDHCFKGLRTV